MMPAPPDAPYLIEWDGAVATPLTLIRWDGSTATECWLHRETPDGGFGTDRFGLTPFGV